MNNKRLMRIGIVGTIVAALCCVTPILLGLLALLGLGAVTGYLDYVLLPALAGFLGLIVYAVCRRAQDHPGSCCTQHFGKEQEP